MPASDPTYLAQRDLAQRRRDWLTTLPKVELHVHLEGSITASTAVELAIANGQNPADVLGLEDGDYPRRYASFDHFIAVFLATSRQLRSPEALAMVAEAFATNQRDQHVRWTEATFTVSTLVDQGLTPGEIWDALRRGFGAVDGVSIGLIIDTVRDLGAETAERTVAFVEGADALIVGLGLTGIEGSVPESEFRLLRDAADALGLGLVVHAGETGSADNVRAALDDLGADRIGHGIAAANDLQLLRRLATDGTILDVCPSSNVTLGLVASLDQHPLPHLIAHGVAVTINSDDPPFFATTLTDELAHAMRIASLGPGDIVDLQRRAIAGSLAPDAIKATVDAELNLVDVEAADARLR